MALFYHTNYYLRKEQRHFCLLLLLLFTISFADSNLVYAFDPHKFEHEPPVVTSPDTTTVKIHILAQDIRRGRVLVADSIGYKIVDMTKEGENLTANLSFGQGSTLRYQFQLEALSGGIFETDFYSVRLPATKDLEEEIGLLQSKKEALMARKQQLENTIHNLKVTDPRIFGRQKDAEIGRALIVLGKKEREYSELVKTVEREKRGIVTTLAQTPKGQEVAENREYLAEEINNIDLEEGK